MFVTVLLLVFCILVIALLPIWSFSKRWGNGPAAGAGAVLMVLIILMVAGVAR